MPDEALQIAFEIKTTCDEISRRLLRWHWEKKPGDHSLEGLLRHLEQRQKESPEYYDRLPDLSGKTSWQQLDTTLCMRVLLDPEKDTDRPLDLLGNTAHPAAARRACNAVRTARNQAAHASDRSEGVQAAILFDEAVECLEEGYAGAAFKTAELEQYYRMAQDFLTRCGAKTPRRSAEKAEDPTPRSTAGERTSRQSSSSRRANQSNRADRPAHSQSRSGQGTRRQSQSGRKGQQNRSRNSRAAQRKRKAGPNRAMVLLLLGIALLGLLARAWSMGLLFH